MGPHYSTDDFIRDQTYSSLHGNCPDKTHDVLNCCFLVVQMNETLAVDRILKVPWSLKLKLPLSLDTNNNLEIVWIFLFIWLAAK